jgi:hypothetical protein
MSQVSDRKPMTNAEKQRRWRERRKAELERLRNENLRLRRQLERLTPKSRSETAERAHVD